MVVTRTLPLSVEGKKFYSLFAFLGFVLCLVDAHIVLHFRTSKVL